MTALHLIGWLVIASGICLWSASLRHERRRHQILREEPQCAPKRVGPEIHALVTLFTAVGVVMVAGWWMGLAAVVVQGLVACVLLGR